jgi:hypothetical protein
MNALLWVESSMEKPQVFWGNCADALEKTQEKSN